MHDNGRTLTQELKDCIAACLACAQICNECADDMIGMEGHPTGSQGDLMTRCIRLCRECADVCFLAAAWMSRLSPLSERLCRLCAEVCDLCAEACEQHAPQHELCGRCARECRRCADACRRMTARSKAA
jgi:uncharacterized protein DUF326